MQCTEIFSPGLSIINKDPALILLQQRDFDSIFFHKFIRHATNCFNFAFFWQMVIEFIGMVFRIYGLSVIGWLWCIWSRPEQHSTGYEPAPQPLFYSQFSQHVSFKLRPHTPIKPPLPCTSSEVDLPYTIQFFSAKFCRYHLKHKKLICKKWSDTTHYLYMYHEQLRNWKM